MMRRPTFRLIAVALLVSGLAFAQPARAADDINTATFEEGYAYYGSGDVETAQKIFWRLAAQGDMQAQYYIGVMLDTGQGMGQDPYNAASWFRKSAMLGYVPAMVSLAYNYSVGRGVTKSEKDAREWYSKAAQYGDPIAQNNLGTMLRDGVGGPVDLGRAAQWFLLAAKQGNARAQYNIANLYHQATIPGSNEEAVRWYAEAAKQGDMYAETALATMYFLGQGTEKDEIAAQALYTRAANRGYEDAQVALGHFYESGAAGEKRPGDAAIWYARAAQQGNTLAQYRLGVLYETGTGVPKDLEQSVSWYKKSAEKDYLPALGALCRLYGADKSASGSMIKDIYEKGAARGEAYCQLQLARGYHAGTGGFSKDPVQAYLWFALAANSLPDGEDKAGAVVSRISISNALSEAQLSDARKRVTDWKPAAVKKP